MIEYIGVKGATVKVDDVDKGQVNRIDVDADAHHVVVTLKGKTLFDDIVNVELGAEVDIKPKAPAVAKLDPGGGDSGEDDDDGDGTPKIRKTAPRGSQEVFITGGGVFDVGFRQFKYDQPKGGLAATENEVGQVMIGPAVELWPAALLGVNYLRGLSLFAKVEFGVNHQAVLDPTNQPVGPTTFWGNLEIDARHRWKIGDTGMFEANGGFVRDQMQFNDVNPASAMELSKVPVVDYRSIRLGARAGIALDKLEPYVSLEGRLVISAGDLATRFDNPSITGGRAAVGASTTLGPVFVRLEGSLVYYGWTFKPESATGPNAEGARDLIEAISVLVGITR